MIRDWRRFVIDHGWKARAVELAAVVGQPEADVARFRSTRTCTRRKTVRRFAELFALWHGRAPRDNEWPAPKKSHRGSYDWQAPELALLASLVGRLGKPEIARILTKRLRKVTGDRTAGRTLNGVQMAINHQLGMVTTDVVGGMTIAEAGREVGSRAVIYQCIRSKQLRPFRVGRLWVIPRKAWDAWKATRVFPPKGYVQLSSIRRALGIKSDKLPEWARMGYIPTAVRCNPFGLGIKSTKFGTWFIDAKVARKLVADRRAGRAMPWWGMPEPDNMKQTWRLLQERRHPAACRTCAQIWGKKGSPLTWDDYVARYHPLDLGAKRHLTRIWTPGMSIAEVARWCGTGRARVERAIAAGVVNATQHRGHQYVSKTDATAWKHRKCPTGDGEKSWMAIPTACKQYLFSRGQIRKFIEQGVLRSKVGTNGPMRGVTYVSRHQCGRLRQRLGFTEQEAARRVGVSIDRLRTLLKGAEWRGLNAGIPLDTVRALQRRIECQDGGYTIEQAAAKLGVSIGWIDERKLDGTIRLTRAKWDRRRLYITAPMLERLVQAKRHPQKREKFGAHWLLQSKAAVDAGVSNATLIAWADAGELERRQSLMGWRYPRKAVRARARRYWQNCRLKRAIPPEWLQRERAERDRKTKGDANNGIDRRQSRARQTRRPDARPHLPLARLSAAGPAGNVGL